MEYLGIIHRPDDPSGIDLAAWEAVVDASADLTRPEPRKGTNPFTGKPAEFKAAPGSAMVIVDGKQVGSITMSENGSNQLVVCGPPSEVGPCARSVAAELHAVFLKDAD